jgi:hypothetical protein
LTQHQPTEVDRGNGLLCLDQPFDAGTGLCPDLRNARIGRVSIEEPATTAAIEFDLDSWDEAPYDEPDEGPKLTRITITKTYRGVLGGKGVTEVLTAQGTAGALTGLTGHATEASQGDLTLTYHLPQN